MGNLLHYKMGYVDFLYIIKAISVKLTKTVLQQSNVRFDTLWSKADALQRHLFKHLLQLVDIAKTKLHDVARHLFYKASFFRYKFLSIRDSGRHKQVDTHFAVIRQEQIRALNPLHDNVYAYILRKAQHLYINTISRKIIAVNQVAMFHSG